MLFKQDLVNKVKDYFDLNIYETKVWLALLTKGVASAGEIAAISGVPRSRTYDVLETLQKRGFAIAKLGKPAKFIGVKPRMILEKLKNNARSDAEEKIVQLSKIKETGEFTELESLYNSGIKPIRTEDISVAIKGKANISNNIREIFKNAKNEIIICTNVEELMSKGKLFHQTFESLAKNGVKIRIALSGDAKLIKKVSERFKMQFDKVNVNAKFFIVDRKEIMFYLSKNSDENDIAIWLNSEFFAEAFASLFERALRD